MSDQYSSRTERRKQQKKRPAKKSATTKAKSNKRSIVKKVFLTLVVLMFLSLAAGVGTFAFMVKGTPDLDAALLRDPISSKIYDKDGEYITSIGSENREYVKYEDIPPMVKDAILATEDVRFFDHHGIDILRIGSAAIGNITQGFGSQGASTITQQVVKMSFLTPEKTLKRKAQEAWLAFQLERQYSKEEIFEMYVNKAFMSGNMSGGIHGIKTAAGYYFDKELDELTLNEAALLAGMPQSPNNYNPFKHPDRADKRKNVVLSLMEQHGKITSTEMAAAKQESITAYLTEPKETENKKYNAFIDMVVEEVQEMGEYNPYSDGLKIYTTLDRSAQDYMDKLLNTEEIINYPSEEFQAGVALTDTKTGEVRAIGGGRNQKVERGYNYAVDLKQRQPGSVIKPLVDYGPAIEYLKWSTHQQLDDRPYSYSNGSPIRNAGGSYMGPLSMRSALVYSRNIPALQTYQEVGHEKANEFLNNVGIQLSKEESENESNSIGAMSGISPLDLAGAYAAFGNEGQYNKPHTVKKIVLSDGDTEIKNDIKPKAAMSDYTAYMISDVLKDVMDEGTGRRANIPGLHVAGKTGTTNYTEKEKREFGIPNSGSPDSWFVGYTTNYTAAIWTGYASKKEYLSKESQQISKKLFKNLMEEVSSDVETKNFKRPKSVVELPVIKGSNPTAIAGKNVPKSEITYELFVKGEEPKKVFNDFKKEEKEKEESKDGITGLSAAYDAASQSISVSWSFNGEGSPSFTVSSNGASQAVSGTSTVISNVQPGQTYNITVTATVNGAAAGTASTSVTVPGEATPEEPETPPVDPENPDGENPDGNGDNNGGGTPPPNGGGDNNGGGTPPNNGGGDNNGGGTPPPDNGGGDNNGGGTPPPDNGGGDNNGGGTPPPDNGGGTPPDGGGTPSTGGGGNSQQGKPTET